MPWIEISAEEYSKLYAKDVDNLSVYSSATCIGPGYIGQRYFSEDYIFTEWVLRDQTFPCLKALKSHDEWKHWKWEGPAPTEDGE